MSSPSLEMLNQSKADDDLNLVDVVLALEFGIEFGGIATSDDIDKSLLHAEDIVALAAITTQVLGIGDFAEALVGFYHTAVGLADIAVGKFTVVDNLFIVLDGFLLVQYAEA